MNFAVLSNPCQGAATYCLDVVMHIIIQNLNFVQTHLGIPAHNLMYTYEGMAGCNSILLFRKVIHTKMNTHSYENLWLSNKQDFISYTDVAHYLINCEHQLSFSPQHNFWLLRKMEEGGKEREVLSTERHKSWRMI